jgi:hypothetical protein
MKHRLAAIFAALSLLVCVSTCALWVRSYWHGDRVDAFVKGSAYRQTPVWMGAFVSGNGGFGISEAHSNTYYVHEETWRRVLERTPERARSYYRAQPAVYPQWTAGESQWRWAGFQWTRIERRDPTSWSIQRSIVLPYWLPCLITAIAPAIWLWARLARSRRRRRGLCLSCGYDLTGNESGTCPECGARRREA